MDQQLLLIQAENKICTLTLNRPEKKNSLSLELVELFGSTLEELAEDDTVRAVILRGAGEQAFCAGFDIGSLPTQSKTDADQRLKSLDQVESLLQRLIRFPYPVIAMLNGHAFGAGYELAVCCDIRIAADNIKIGMPPAKLGLVYPWTGLKRFVSVLGLAGMFKPNLAFPVLVLGLGQFVDQPGRVVEANAVPLATSGQAQANRDVRLAQARVAHHQE